MNLKIDRQTFWLVGGVLALLASSSLIGWVLSLKSTTSEAGRTTVQNLNARIRAWWMMVAIFGLALATGLVGSVILFGLTSFLALREFITLTPTRHGDHRTLFWVFFVIVPLQYYLIAIQWRLYVILIPVYAFLFIPIRSAAAGDCTNFLERTAKIQWALMVCVYCLSYVPALLNLRISGYEGQDAKLMFYLVLVAQISDVMQYVWGKTLGRHKIAPTVSPNKTWEGLIGGVATATLIGASLWWATPFSPLQSAGMSFMITLLGFGGGLVMSAIKRDRGVKDYGSMIQGHGGVLDRIDSLCFAAPVFFHLTSYFFE